VRYVITSKVWYINEDMEIKNLATLKEAKEDSLSFFHDRKIYQ